MVFNNLADIMGLARSFANMRHSSQTAHTLMMSALNHVREKRDMENKTELNQVINSCLTLLDKKLSVSQINLRIDLPEQVMLKIHSGQLHQIILNLLLNAHDAFQHDKNSGRTRYIKIDFVSENSNGIVSVEDNGSGIPEEIKETIFERFYSTKGKKGSGIGLFVSKRLAEKNQGQLTVKSQPGKTVFKLNLPLGGLQK